MTNKVKKLNKKDLFELILKKDETLKKDQLEKTFSLLTESIVEIVKTLNKDEQLNLGQSFGSFVKVYKPSRKARNPKTGESVMTKPKNSAKFKLSNKFKNEIA